MHHKRKCSLNIKGHIIKTDAMRTQIRDCKENQEKESRLGIDAERESGNVTCGATGVAAVP